MTPGKAGAYWVSASKALAPREPPEGGVIIGSFPLEGGESLRSTRGALGWG